MKYVKLFENFLEENQSELFDVELLQGNDKIVFDAVDMLLEDIRRKNALISNRMDSWRMEPIITDITDQNQDGGPRDFPEDKRYFIFVNNFLGASYIEVETGIELERNMLYAYKPDFSSHGRPASYGKSVYSYNRKTGNIKYDADFFKFFLNK